MSECVNLNQLMIILPPENIEEVEGDIVKEAVDHQITDPPQEPACTLNNDRFESLTNADDEVITSSDSRKCRKRKTKGHHVRYDKHFKKPAGWTIIFQEGNTDV
ncbi:hypothetical protein PTKIN_Ptkin09bG0098600 [Pterospermum kingtungense]